MTPIRESAGREGAILRHYAKSPVALKPRKYGQNSAGLKPQGLWLSVDGNGDGWADWCRGAEFNEEGLAVVHSVSLRDDANVLWLTELWEIQRFNDEFGIRGWGPYDDFRIDWVKAAEALQGLIIAPYQWAARREFFWYYGWDCASGCIWDTSAIASLEPIPDPSDNEELHHNRRVMAQRAVEERG